VEGCQSRSLTCPKQSKESIALDFFAPQRTITLGTHPLELCPAVPSDLPLTWGWKCSDMTPETVEKVNSGCVGFLSEKMQILPEVCLRNS
jgi:hypothetical protein